MGNEQNIMLIETIKQQIKNNQFKDKESLMQYLLNLRNNNMLSIITNDKIQELLNLFDSITKKEEMPLDMQNYANASIENKDLIVSKENGRVLTTLEGSNMFEEEFKQSQNEVIANNKDGLINANTVFQHMADHQKEEIYLISLSEAISRENISVELLEKIKFFITNVNITPHLFKVDIENEIFYNTETNEVYDIRKNENTNQYEIYKNNEKTYQTNAANSANHELTNEEETEEMSYESELNKPKVRVRKKENHPYMNNAAFTKVSFLIINIITFSLLVAMIILLNK